MREEAGELVLQLIRLARGRIEPSAYVKAHCESVRRILISWNQDLALQSYVPRLLHYCLNVEDAPPPLVLYTFQFITGQSSMEEFVKRLQIQSAVLDQLNSVPWPYGIRSRREQDTQSLAPIIPPGIPIDPGQEISRTFRTTCESQTYARIELFAGPETTDRTEGCTPLLARRVRLPEGLPMGKEVEVGIKRMGEAGIRLELRIPHRDGPIGSWWWIEDSAGFSDFATDVVRRFQELQESEGERKGLRLLLQGCLHFLNQSWHLLSEEDANRLVSWVQQTSTALVQRNEEGLKNAVYLLLGDLDAVRNESVAVVLQSLLLATGAPQEVTTEFERLATLLLRRPEDPDTALELAWTAVDDWYAEWRRSFATADERPEPAERLFLVLDSVRRLFKLGVSRHGALSSAKLRNQLAPLLASVRKALAKRNFLSTSEGALDILSDWLTDHVVVAKPPGRTVSIVGKTIESAAELTAHLSIAFVTTGRDLLHLTSAPNAIQGRFLALGEFIRADAPAGGLRSAKAQMVQLVSSWYEQWRLDPARNQEPVKARQAEMLIDLLDALESPQVREMAVENMMEKEPFETGLLRSFAAAFRTSRWTQDVRGEARELVNYHLRVIDQLGVQLQREDLYYARAFQSLAEASGISKLSAEDQEPLGDWRALVPEEMHRVVIPPPWSQEAEADQVLPADADELLEAVPDGSGPE
jgi:hypothetical protein